MSCGCEERQAQLNEWRPGLGDKVKKVADPVKNILRPDAAAFLWFMVGAFVVPYVLAKVRAPRG